MPSIAAFVIFLSLSPFAQAGFPVPQNMGINEQLAVVAGLNQEVPDLVHQAIAFGSDPFNLLQTARALWDDEKLRPFLHPDLFTAGATYHVVKLKQNPGGASRQTILISSFDERQVQNYWISLEEAQTALNRQHPELRVDTEMYFNRLQDWQEEAQGFDGLMTGLVLASTSIQDIQKHQELFKELHNLILDPNIDPSNWIRSRLATLNPTLFHGKLPVERDGWESYFKRAITAQRTFVKYSLAIPFLFNARLEYQWQALHPKGQDLLNYFENAFHHQKDLLPKSLQKEVSQVIRRYGIQQVRKTATHLSVETVPFEGELVIVPTLYALFRGFIGNDCSSSYSSLIGLLKSETVALVRKRGKFVGYAAWTQTESGGKPSLYVHTVQGNLSGREIPSLLSMVRGYAVAKQGLDGTSLLTVASKSQLHSFINNPIIRNLIESLAAVSSSVEQSYPDQELREKLQNEFSMASYDMPANNTKARALALAAADIDIHEEQSDTALPDVTQWPVHERVLLASMIEGQSNAALTADVLTLLNLSREQYQTMARVIKEPTTFTFSQWWDAVNKNPQSFLWLGDRLLPAIGHWLKADADSSDASAVSNVEAILKEIGRIYKYKVLMNTERWAEELDDDDFIELFEDLPEMDGLFSLLRRFGSPSSQVPQQPLLPLMAQAFLQRPSLGEREEFQKISEQDKDFMEDGEDVDILRQVFDDYHGTPGLSQILKSFIVDGHYSFIGDALFNIDAISNVTGLPTVDGDEFEKALARLRTQRLFMDKRLQRYGGKPAESMGAAHWWSLTQEIYGVTKLRGKLSQSENQLLLFFAEAFGTKTLMFNAHELDLSTEERFILARDVFASMKESYKFLELITTQDHAFLLARRHDLLENIDVVIQQFRKGCLQEFVSEECAARQAAMDNFLQKALEADPRYFSSTTSLSETDPSQDRATLVQSALGATRLRSLFLLKKPSTLEDLMAQEAHFWSQSMSQLNEYAQNLPSTMPAIEIVKSMQRFSQALGVINGLFHANALPYEGLRDVINSSLWQSGLPLAERSTLLSRLVQDIHFTIDWSSKISNEPLSDDDRRFLDAFSADLLGESQEVQKEGSAYLIKMAKAVVELVERSPGPVAFRQKILNHLIPQMWRHILQNPHFLGDEPYKVYHALTQNGFVLMAFASAPQGNLKTELKKLSDLFREGRSSRKTPWMSEGENIFDFHFLKGLEHRTPHAIDALDLLLSKGSDGHLLWPADKVLEKLFEMMTRTLVKKAAESRDARIGNGSSHQRQRGMSYGPDDRDFQSLKTISELLKPYGMHGVLDAKVLPFLNDILDSLQPGTGSRRYSERSMDFHRFGFTWQDEEKFQLPTYVFFLSAILEGFLESVKLDFKLMKANQVVANRLFKNRDISAWMGLLKRSLALNSSAPDPTGINPSARGIINQFLFDLQHLVDLLHEKGFNDPLYESLLNGMPPDCEDSLLDKNVRDLKK